ncbi:hypothetical protein KY284_036049 [Solanum tuberosum]|nr:hypothetical protein KY284_036049 [Solanum tuberosum]
MQSDKVNAAEHSLGSPCERPQVSDESTTISRPKAQKDKKMELLSNAKERLELFRIEEGEKGKHVSSNKKSLRKVKRKLETLQGE